MSEQKKVFTGPAYFQKVGRKRERARRVGELLDEEEFRASAYSGERVLTPAQILAAQKLGVDPQALISNRTEALLDDRWTKQPLTYGEDGYVGTVKDYVEQGIYDGDTYQLGINLQEQEKALREEYENRDWTEKVLDGIQDGFDGVKLVGEFLKQVPFIGTVAGNMLESVGNLGYAVFDGMEDMVGNLAQEDDFLEGLNTVINWGKDVGEAGVEAFKDTASFIDPRAWIASAAGWFGGAEMADLLENATQIAKFAQGIGGASSKTQYLMANVPGAVENVTDSIEKIKKIMDKTQSLEDSFKAVPEMWNALIANNEWKSYRELEAKIAERFEKQREVFSFLQSDDKWKSYFEALENRANNADGRYDTMMDFEVKKYREIMDRIKDYDFDKMAAEHNALVKENEDRLKELREKVVKPAAETAAPVAPETPSQPAATTSDYSDLLKPRGGASSLDDIYRRQTREIPRMNANELTIYDLIGGNQERGGSSLADLYDFLGEGSMPLPAPPPTPTVTPVAPPVTPVAPPVTPSAPQPTPRRPTPAAPTPTWDASEHDFTSEYTYNFLLNR
jgi:chemotaxis regulatin CheY-phosphate phosphatase CheZ